MYVTSRFVSRGDQFHPEYPLQARLRALAQLSCRQLRCSLDRCNIHIHKHIYTILLFVSLADALIRCESSSDEDWKRSLSLLLHRSDRRRDVARRKPERETGRKSDDFLPHTLLQGKLRYARYLNQSREWKRCKTATLTSSSSSGAKVFGD